MSCLIRQRSRLNATKRQKSETWCKSVVLLIIGITIATGAFSQVIITPQLPAIGLYVKNQLWNASVFNSDKETRNVRLKIQFSDAATNQQIFTATSRMFAILPGLNVIQYNSVLPVTYNLTNTAYPVDGSPDGFLPIGVFNICYVLMEAEGEVPGQLAEECITMEVEPLSAPVLIYPEKEARITESRPIFNWLPAAPANLFSNLNYRLILVQVLPSQSPADAIQQNIPLFNQQNIPTTMVNFPSTLSPLDTGKYYAWQVAAVSNVTVVSKSEVGVFQIQYSQIDSAIRKSGQTYRALDREQGGALAITYSQLGYQYTNELNDSTVTVKWYDFSSAGRERRLLQEETIPLKFGVNYLLKRLNEIPGVKNKDFYLLELINSQMQSWWLKFEYRQ